MCTLLFLHTAQSRTLPWTTVCNCIFIFPAFSRTLRGSTAVIWSTMDLGDETGKQAVWLTPDSARLGITGSLQELQS